MSFFLAFVSCRQQEGHSVTADSASEEHTEALDTTLNIAFITGQFQPETHARFVPVPGKYADRKGMFVQKDVLDAFVEMYNAAQDEGIQLVIRSAARNHAYQKGIWERKWLGEQQLSDGTRASDIADPVLRAQKILEYSAMPGTSRHHWGTDIDLNSFTNSWFDKGEGLRLFNWLNAHAESFGFCRPYTEKTEQRPFGYNEEKWHWSYSPLASKYLAFAEQHLDIGEITGFLGSETAQDLDVIEKYILGISPVCK